MVTPVHEQINPRKRTRDTSESEASLPRNKRQRQSPNWSGSSHSTRVVSIDIKSWVRGETKELFTMNHALDSKLRENFGPRPRPLSRKRSHGTSVNSAASGRSSQDGNNDEYDNRYVDLLATKGFFMLPAKNNPVTPSEDELRVVESLMKKSPPLPAESRFDKDVFHTTMRNMEGQNEKRVIRDIGELVFPSAQYLSSSGKVDAKDLVDVVDEPWVQAIPITGKVPWPDITIGYDKREAFTDRQLAEFSPYLGEPGTEVSWFGTTTGILFPFIVRESKRSNGRLDKGENQNGQAGFISARNVVKLCELVGRNTIELDRKFLAFSVTHSDREVRIHGYFPLVKEDVSYHRHEITSFLLKADNGKDRWTAYGFVASIYQYWAPLHKQRIQSFLDDLPRVNQDAQVRSTALSQHIAGSSISGTDPAEWEMETPHIDPESNPTGTSLSPQRGGRDAVSRG